MAFPEPEFTDPAVELAHRSAIRSIERVVHETAEPTPPEQALAYIVGLLRNGPALVITVRACPRNPASPITAPQAAACPRAAR